MISQLQSTMDINMTRYLSKTLSKSRSGLLSPLSLSSVALALVTGTFMNLLPALAQTKVNTTVEAIESSALVWSNSSVAPVTSNVASNAASTARVTNEPKAVISPNNSEAARPVAAPKATRPQTKPLQTKPLPVSRKANTQPNTANNPKIAQATQTNTQNTRINGSGQTRTQTNVQTTPTQPTTPASTPTVTNPSATPSTPKKQPVPVAEKDLVPRIPYALRQPKYNPSLSAGIPSGTGMGTGDSFIGLFGSTAGKARDSIDGSIAMGTGIGDPYRFIALEGVFNITSIRRFASNGTFDLKLHRNLYQGANGEQVSAAVGWSGFAAYGSDAGGQPSTLYGAVTWNQALDPKNSDNPMLISITGGMGGGSYRNDTNGTGPGVFGGLGLQVAPNLGVSTGWSGQGLNFGVSYLPVKTMPLYLTAIYSDVANAGRSGSQLILGVTYGFNYLPTTR
jgi:hypothetical protein